jgi:hypothetical protein
MTRPTLILLSALALADCLREKGYEVVAAAD